MKFLIQSQVVGDLSAAATIVFTYKAKNACKIYTEQSFVLYEEIVAAAGFSSTTPVVDIQIDGTQIATHSPNLTSGQVVGDVGDFTVNATNLTNTNGVYEMAAGEVLTFEVATAGAGGTVTGTTRAFICIDESR